MRSSISDTDRTILEMTQELEGIDASMLSRMERAQFLAFRAGYALLRRLRPRPSVSELLRAGSESVRARQKTRMAATGPTAEAVGGHHLSAREQHAFMCDGVVGPFDLGLDDGERAALASIAQEAPETFPHLTHPQLLEVALDPRITDRVASILGSDVDIVRSSVFVKKGGGASAHSPWHMAPSSNYGADERANETDYLTVWIALTPARRENGCLKIVPGSFGVYPNGLLLDVAAMEVYLDDPFQAFLAATVARKLRRRNDRAPRSRFDAWVSDRVNGSAIIQQLLFTNGFLADELRARGLAARVLACEPSEFYIFTSENQHGSVPNISEDTRVAFVVRYGTPRSPMSRTENVKTLVDALPEALRKRLRADDGEQLVPVIRAAGTAKTGRDGARMYL